MNGRDNAFVRCVSVCLSVCVCAAAGQCELNANSSKTVKATDLKFDILVPKDSPDMTPKNFSKSGVVGSRDPLNFWALNANNSKTVKATDLKFGTSVLRDSLDMTPNFFPKGGVAKVTWPTKFFGIKC